MFNEKKNDIVTVLPSHEFGITSFDDFREKAFYGGMTTDEGRPHHNSSIC